MDVCPREVKPRPREKVFVTSVPLSSELSVVIILVVGLFGRRLRVLGLGSRDCSSVDCCGASVTVKSVASSWLGVEDRDRKILESLFTGSASVRNLLCPRLRMR